MEMETLVLKLLNMSITAGWLILAVLLLRLLLKKAPAWISCLLWGLVALRLVCPFSLESVFSLIPSRETIPAEIALSPMPSVNSGVHFVDSRINPVLQDSFAPNPGTSANPLQVWLFIAGIFWAAGVCVLILYAAGSSMRLFLRLRTAVRLQGSVYLSEFIDTPFLFGLVRPRIYLPSRMPEKMRAPVIAHEQAHVERLDHIWKILGFLLLAVYWFHPLCWAAYVLFCRDLELACDEKVIRHYDAHQKKEYSEALLACSLRQPGIRICPLAFGETDVKKRIRSVLHYKKPALWVVSAAVLVCAAAAVCFLTDPVEGSDPSGESFSGASENAVFLSGNENGRIDDVSSGGSVQNSDGSEPDSPTLNSDGSGSNGSSLDSDGSGNNGSPAACTSPEQLVNQWVQAFVSRNGNHIAAMASGKVCSDLADRELLYGPENQRGFGQASPWPLDTDTGAAILSMDNGQAQINYYAWTSAPHVTVWRETLSYELRDGVYIVTGEKLQYLDNISTLEAFTMAYGSPTALDGSGGSYLDTGAWEILERNIGLSSTMLYQDLFWPETAAIKLLNLSDDPDKVRVERLLKEEEDIVGLQILFAGETETVKVSMTRPGGACWVPIDYRVTPLYRLSQLDWTKVRNQRLSGPENPNWRDVIRLGRIPEQDITIYGYNDAECMGQGVAVDVGGTLNFYDWGYTSSRTILPEFYWDDEREQLQAKLCIYTGTGAAAWSLHVLQLKNGGILEDNAFELNTFRDMLEERIEYVYEKDTGLLTLLDRSTGNTLASASIEDADIIFPEIGMISQFLLGEQIFLQIEPGYFPDDAPIAEYDLPALKAEVLMETVDGKIVFSLGEIRKEVP